jgi:hypothetical protein
MQPIPRGIVYRGVPLGVSMVLLMMAFVAAPSAVAGNIIGFANNATSCGGSTICSTNGTTGYLINGTGQAFDLSTISSWFQIDPEGVNQLPGQPEAEPDGGAGNFLVVNDTGTVVTSYSLTLTDTFNSMTPGEMACSGLQPPTDPCLTFQIHGGAANYFSVMTLTGPDCDGGCGTSSADFAPNQVTYNWSAGTDGGVPIGATFDLNFASWAGSNTGNANNAYVTLLVTPEPASMALLGIGLLCGGWFLRRRVTPSESGSS